MKDPRNMPSGPEMDAMIAKVFALPPEPYSTDANAAFRLLYHVAGRKYFSWTICQGDGTGAEPLCEVDICRGNHHKIGWGQGIFWEDDTKAHDHDERFVDDSFEPPHLVAVAICRAILDAARSNSEELNRRTAGDKRKIAINL